MKSLDNFIKEPYRIFFPLGILLFLCGILIWVPQIWNAGNYPVVLHKYLLLNGFTACFIGGFLMTAVPKFSGTFPARWGEVSLFFLIVILGLIPAHMDNEKLTLLTSFMQAILLLIFLFTRIGKRQQNPPYSFIFIFAGLILWALSALHGALIDPESLKRLHYEGAIASIILCVGSRLIPGILGHVEIVREQRLNYERPVPLLRTIPLHFVILILSFIASYFLNEETGNWIRAAVVLFISFFYWRLHNLPADKTALTWCIWGSAWLINLSFLLRAFWFEGMIHASHSFFINGIALLSFLIATRVLQSHGPQDKMQEKKKVLYFVTGLVFLAAATRVSAYLMPEQYLTHLGYSSIILALAALLWSFNFLKFVFIFPKGRS